MRSTRWLVTATLAVGSILAVARPAEASDLDLLTVAEFDSVAAAPSRTAFWGSEGWADTDGNGCNAKEDAMASQSLTDVTRDGRCKVMTGRWLGYDGGYSTERAQIEGDHLVPLENAAGHGAGAWDAARRRAFYNDPLEIRITSAASNASKSDSGPEKWRPADLAQQCSYATGWIAVKVKWQLSVSAAEHRALAEMLTTCGATTPGTPTTSPTPAVTCANELGRVPEWYLVFSVEDTSGCAPPALPDDRWLRVEFMVNDATWAQRCVAEERRPENIGNVFMICWPNDGEVAAARQRQAN